MHYFNFQLCSKLCVACFSGDLILTTASDPQKIVKTLKGGHTATVRCLHWDNSVYCFQYHNDVVKVFLHPLRPFSQTIFQNQQLHASRKRFDCKHLFSPTCLHYKRRFLLLYNSTKIKCRKIDVSKKLLCIMQAIIVISKLCMRY